MNSLVFWCEDFFSFLLREDMPEHRQPLCSAGSVLFPALCSPGSSPVKSIIMSLIAPGLYPSQDIATASSLSHCKQHCHPSLALRPWSLLLCGCLSSSLHQIFSLSPQSPAFSAPHSQSLMHTASPQALPCRILQEDNGRSHHPCSSGQLSPCP